jgi:hypothetical protein
MAGRYLAPGVFTSETDISGVSTGIAQIGAAFVGPTLKGPAFVPTKVYSFSDFTTQFGQETPTSYVPYSVRNYLKAAPVATVVRILGDGGWKFDGTTKKLAAIVSGSTILTVLHPTLNVNDNAAELSSTVASGSLESFNLVVSGSGVSNIASASLHTSNNSYITKIFGNNPSVQTGSAYPYLLFNGYLSSSVAAGSSSYSDSVVLVTSQLGCTFTSSNQGGYQEAITPWIISSAGVRLFRLHHISHGTDSNTDVKIAITDITPSTVDDVYSSFSILVRDINDTDNVPSIRESFNTLTLNPDDASSYISQKIGDEYSVYDSNLQKIVDFGDYDNNSSYVWIEVSDAVRNASLDSKVYPAGFEAVYETISGFSGYFLPSASCIQSNTGSVIYSGFDYTNPDNLNYLNPVPKEATVGHNSNFIMNANDTKFIVPMQGGSDGMNYSTIKNSGANITGTNSFGFDLSTSTSPGTLSYVQALDILSNAEQYDMNLLVTPGVINTLHPYVVQYGVSMVESRTDAVYILDICGQNDTIATAKTSAASINSNYAATYYSWVKIIDSSNNKKVAVPPSVVIPQVIAYSDSVSQEWFAPAGLNRGGISGVIGLVNKLTEKERSVLYPAKINPIANFPNTGIAVWGQKTLQNANTALNRINVRRLLINLRKFSASVGKYLVFDGNTTQTRNKFKNAVTPYYSYVQSKQGVYAIQLIMDESNNTADVIDQNQLVGKIKVWPTKSAEFILLNFEINPTGTLISNGTVVTQ